MTCEFCSLVARKDLILFEDELCAAVLAPRPAALGHILILPREHVTIIEQAPPPLVSRLFEVASRMSLLLFNKLGTRGTNILLPNGVAAGQQVAHLAVSVLARVPDDGLQFQWEAKELPEEELAGLEQRLSAALSSPKDPASPASAPKAAELADDPENYLLRHLHRRP